MSDMLELNSRRNWLLRTLAGAIAVTVGALLYPVVRFLWPRPVTTSGAVSVVAPYRVNQLRPDEKGDWPAPFNFGGTPCLIVLTPEGSQRAANGVKLKPGDVKAFNAVCTHTDCTVQFEPNLDRVFCACHNGVYDLNGHNVSGPPPRPLESYKVVLRGEEPGKEEIIVSRS